MGFVHFPGAAPNIRAVLRRILDLRESRNFSRALRSEMCLHLVKHNPEQFSRSPLLFPLFSMPYICLVSWFLKSLLSLCCLSPTALTFILNIHTVLPLLPFSWSLEIFNNVSKKDELFLHWASQCLACFCPNFCNFTFLSFTSALVPDLHVRVLLASLFGGSLSLGWPSPPRTFMF